MHFSIQTHTQNMVQVNNLPTDNHYNEWNIRSIDREREEIYAVMYFSIQTHSIKTWDKITTHPLTIQQMQHSVNGYMERKEIHALFDTNTYTLNKGQDNNSPPENVHNTTSGTL